MKRSILALLLCISAIGAVHAQGLIGTPSCPRSLTQSPPLIAGDSDSERWSKFQGIQSSLIGMTQVQVVKELGPGQAFIKSEEFTLKRRNEQERCCLVYQIATTKVPGLARKSAPIELTIVFKDDHVQSYSVEAIY